MRLGVTLSTGLQRAATFDGDRCAGTDFTGLAATVRRKRGLVGVSPLARAAVSAYMSGVSGTVRSLITSQLSGDGLRTDVRVTGGYGPSLCAASDFGALRTALRATRRMVSGVSLRAIVSGRALSLRSTATSLMLTGGMSGARLGRLLGVTVRHRAGRRG